MFSISQRTMLVATVFAATTGAALAQAVDPAQVRADAAAANKAGLVARGEIGVPAQRGTMPTQMAAGVRSQAVAGIAGR